ncbi:MAG: DUF1273 family protein [Ruminococcus sp.]|nr:DUF1273 family protein [Ruminococcus sp.]
MVTVSAENFITDRSTTCCFTGHRRKDLPFFGNVKKQGMKNLMSSIQLCCIQAYEAGYRTFLTGMAEGTDIFCGSVLLDIKNDSRYPDIKLVCVLPYKEQRRELHDMMDRYYHGILLENADAVIVTGRADERDRYKKRNAFMVDHSSALIAVYKAKQGGSGTLQTINMAKRQGLDLHMIDLDNNPQFYCD